MFRFSHHTRDGVNCAFYGNYIDQFVDYHPPILTVYSKQSLCHVIRRQQHVRALLQRPRLLDEARGGTGIVGAGEERASCSSLGATLSCRRGICCICIFQVVPSSTLTPFRPACITKVAAMDVVKIVEITSPSSFTAHIRKLAHFICL